MQVAFENEKVAFGYPILNGKALEQSLLIKYSVVNGSEIILASDGYPLLCNTLDESEKKRAELVKKDPICFRENRWTKGFHKGNVSFDNRTFCRFVL